jgi:hypothetical protein
LGLVQLPPPALWVQLSPSVEVIAESLPTATHLPPPYATELKLSACDALRKVHSVPVPSAASAAAANCAAVYGVVDDDALDAVDVVTALLAVAVNVYATPLVSPVTAQLPEAPVTVQVLVTPETCGDALTV